MEVMEGVEDTQGYVKDAVDAKLMALRRAELFTIFAARGFLVDALGLNEQEGRPTTFLEEINITTVTKESDASHQEICFNYAVQEEWYKNFEFTAKFNFFNNKLIIIFCYKNSARQADHFHVHNLYLTCTEP